MAYSQHSGMYRERPRKGNGEYVNSYQKRQAWTKEEDEILKQQVSRLGTQSWPDVASGLPGRTSKACSLRWRCFLSPSIIRPNEEPFSQWEIAVIVLTQKMFGNKWNDIANYLPMRCNNDIKNHFNLYLKDKQHQVALENSYLRQGYDLANLLASEPDEVVSRRERLDKERVSSSNFEHGPVKAANRGTAFLRPRASPTKPKPSPRFSPYHLALAEGQADMTGITRSGSGPVLLASTDSDSASPNSQQTYSAFAAHSMANMDALAAQNGGYTAQPALAAAAAGLPASLIYSAAMHAQCSQGTAAFTGYPPQDSVQQEGATDASYMMQSYAAAYHLTGYSAVPVLSNSSRGSATASPAAVVVEEGGTCALSRLAIASHPEDMSELPCTGNVGCGPAGLQQRQQYSDGVDELQHADLPSLIGVDSLGQMPSLPEPVEQGILEGGDGDGTSLRGIFSSDDGEHHLPHANQQLHQLNNSSSQQPHNAERRPFGIDIAAATATAAGVQRSEGCSPPAVQQQQQQPACDTGFPSPSSFTSGGSPVCYFEQQTGVVQAQHAQHASTVQVMQQRYNADASYARDGTYAADSSAAAGHTTATAYPDGSYGQQQCKEMPTDVFASDNTQQYHQMMYQPAHDGQMQQQHLSADKYTPFGHPHHQQQHIHHIYDSASFTHPGHQQQPVGYPSFQPPAVLTAAMDGFDSGKSSHLNALNSPSTMAQSAAAAVVRLAAVGGADSASPTSTAVKPEQQLNAAPPANPQAKQHQQYPDMLQLLPRTPSLDIQDELGPLADLLADDSGEADDRSCNQHLQEECDLLAAAVRAAGAFHETAGGLQQQYTCMDVLPGLNRQSSEQEMLATAACW